MPLIAAPARGSRGTSQMYRYISFQFRVSSFESVFLTWSNFGIGTITRNPKLETRNSLPFHQINLINPDRFAITIERDDDAESDCRFSRSDHDNENCEHLARERIRAAGVLQVTRE